MRDADVGIEVLLLRRAERGDQNSGAWVFPGGVVDASDHESAACCSGLDDIGASATLGLPHGGLAYYVAAVRECFEEAGLLYACDAGESSRGRPRHAGRRSCRRIGAWRASVHRGERTLAELCRAAGLTLALDRLVYFSHWLTPPWPPKRFDTRFFIARRPPHRSLRTTSARWSSSAG